MNCPSAPRPTPTAREILEAAHAAERASVMQWGTASPGGLLAESHVKNSVNSHAPSQGAAVTAMRQGGAL